MALISLPVTAEFARIVWHPLRHIQVNKSAYNNSRKVMDLGGEGWRVSAAIEPAETEAKVRLWRAFIALLRNEKHTFQMPATIGSQHNGADPTVASGGAAAAQSVVVSSVTALTPGMYATIPLTGGGKQLVLITSIAGSTVHFDRELRAAAVIGAAVATKDPYGIVALSSAPEPDDVDGVFTWAFSAEEAF